MSSLHCSPYQNRPARSLADMGYFTHAKGWVNFDSEIFFFVWEVWGNYAWGKTPHIHFGAAS